MLMFCFSSRRRHTRWPRDWSSDVCSSDLWESSCICCATPAALRCPRLLYSRVKLCITLGTTRVAFAVSGLTPFGLILVLVKSLSQLIRNQIASSTREILFITFFMVFLSIKSLHQY